MFFTVLCFLFLCVIIYIWRMHHNNRLVVTSRDVNLFDEINRLIDENNKIIKYLEKEKE